MPVPRRLVAAALAASLTWSQAAAQPRDPVNPTCPANPNWSNIPSMTFTYEVVNGVRVLKAEGRIDEQTPVRLEAALTEYSDLDEIWLRSPGGDARAGTQAGYIIRESTIPTRIPQGWACFSACNFMFMGGAGRVIDPGGLFIVHMFTHLGNGSAVRAEVAQGGERVVGLVSELEQASAVLATEDNDFLIRMGVSRNLLSEVMYQTAAVGGADRATRRCLTAQEIHEYNVARGIEFEE